MFILLSFFNSLIPFIEARFTHDKVHPFRMCGSVVQHVCAPLCPQSQSRCRPSPLQKAPSQRCVVSLRIQPWPRAATGLLSATAGEFGLPWNPHKQVHTAGTLRAWPPGLPRVLAYVRRSFSLPTSTPSYELPPFVHPLTWWWTRGSFSVGSCC